jgi:DNA (cytosine-5)-methyltransferase 1
MSVNEIKENASKVNIISLFAGGGGSSTGYRMAGGNVLLVNEFVDMAADTYSANWPTTIVLRDDIRKLNPIEVLEKINIKPYELDILDGSPPCCAFSNAGKKEKGWGNEIKQYSDKSQSNIEDLFYEYIRFIEVIQPKVFVAENVKGIIQGSAKGYFNDILRKLKSCGYHVEVRLINSAYLGVPQQRERVIFVGTRNDLMKEEYKDNLHPKPKTDFISLNDAFETLVYDGNEVKELSEKIKKYAVYSHLLKLKPGEIAKDYYGLLRKANPELPAYTIVANSGIDQACLKHWDNRPFTIGELKRIMSLPDDYILLGDYRKQAERIGRMVPPLVSKAILENLIEIGVLR